MGHHMDKEMEGVPVLAKEETLVRLGNDQELYNEILTAFIEELPDQFNIIKKHIDSDQNALLEHECHSLKGASANVGAEALAVIAGRMESAARDGHWNVVRTFFPWLEVEYKRVTEYLKIYFSN